MFIHRNIREVGILLPPLGGFWLARADLLVPPQMARPVGVLAAEAVVAVEALRELDLPVEEDGLVLLPDLGPLLVLVPECAMMNSVIRNLHLHGATHLMLLRILHDLLDHSMLHGSLRWGRTLAWGNLAGAGGGDSGHD